jgi:pyruvate/2-oxoglutarate dehydrogenase complex dihydrolipoamide acyltransferase (E2) component
VEIETDKTSMVYESDAAGTLLETVAPAGAPVSVAAPADDAATAIDSTTTAQTTPERAVTDIDPHLPMDAGPARHQTDQSAWVATRTSARARCTIVEPSRAAIEPGSRQSARKAPSRAAAIAGSGEG